MTNTKAIGIDCGSTFCKGILLDGERLLAQAIRPSGWNMAETGALIISDLLVGQTGLKKTIPVVATGYGREKVSALKSVSEITCHAKGAEYLHPGVACVIDIGGQDYKIIEICNGKVLSFQMNDKCAAGSGRFLEMVLKRMEADLAQLDKLLALNKTISINSTCVVFAESEIIGLLAQGVSREEILGGVVASMADKIAGQAARLNVSSPALLTGGLSASQGICRALSKALDTSVEANLNGLFAGAIGAACLAMEI